MSDGTSLSLVLDQVSKDKNIERKILVEALEQAILTAAKKAFGEDREMEAKFNEVTGRVDLSQIIVVADPVTSPAKEITLEEANQFNLQADVGDELLFQIFYDDKDQAKAEEQDGKYGAMLKLNRAWKTFGRFAAQTAKQVLMQLIRDIQRRQMYEEFANREGDIVSGTVQQNDNRYTLLDLGRVEALLPQAEQIAFERYEHGARIKVYIVEVRKTNKGPQIVVSRTHPALVAKLFEIEVPEIANGIVEIKALAREPGHRSKIAVASNDSMVDPVGACVGARGSRVRNITNELRSERIDVVHYSDDPIEFIQAALQPARVREVRLNEEEGIATVIVHDQQLSLAIGKEGQNARLAARLTGWRIDIRSELADALVDDGYLLSDGLVLGWRR